jgi:hypothetical protein
LITDPIFKATVKARWNVIKPYLEMISGLIYMYGEELALSYQFDSKMWPTNTSDIKRYKYDFKDWSGDEQISEFDELISIFVNSYESRLAGMDKLIGQW